MSKVVFACVHNAGRSQMAAAFFNAAADPTKAHAVSAGTQPAERVHPVVVSVMHERGIDLRQIRPRLLTPELVADATLLVTMGCGEQCPIIPGVPREDWPLEDPAALPLASVRTIADAIRVRVDALLRRQGWIRL